MNENSNPERRAAMRAALDAAEHILSAAPGLPFEVDLRGDSVRVFYYDQPDAVAEFAAVFEVPLTLRTEHGGKPAAYLEARGEAFGVTVSAWVLGDEAEQERYAACMPVVALPETWRAAGAA